MIKKILALFALYIFVFNSIYSQEFDLLHEIDNYDSVSKLLQTGYTKDTVVIYKINYEKLKGIIKKSKNEYSLIIIFAWWCDACEEEINEILTMDKIRLLNLFLISPIKRNELYVHYKYLKKFKLNIPTFILDETDYPKSIRKKFNLFRNELCSSCKGVLVFPSFFIVNKKMQVQYAMIRGDTNTEEDINDLIKEINTLINHP